MKLVTMGMARPRATRRYSRGRLGHGTPEQILLGPNRALSKTALISSGLTTPRPAVTTIVTASRASSARYGRKMTTIRWNVPRASLGLAGLPSGPRGARERGITVMAKQTAIEYRGLHINICDTPGHADFGGEVERTLQMVDSALLLVDASEGPLPQTRYVLRKALERRLPVIPVINKIDRPDVRIAEVLDDIYSLLIDLDADESQLDRPVIYTDARKGTATRDLDVPGVDLVPLFEVIAEVTPPPVYDPDAPLQFMVTNLAADPYVGRLAVGRVWNGRVETGQRVALCRRDGSVETARITKVLAHTGTS